MDIFKLVVSYLENLVSVTTSEPMTFFSISGILDLARLPQATVTRMPRLESWENTEKKSLITTM